MLTGKNYRAMISLLAMLKQSESQETRKKNILTKGIVCWGNHANARVYYIAMME